VITLQTTYTKDDANYPYFWAYF